MEPSDAKGRARLLSLIARIAGETADARLLSPLLDGLKSPSLRCRRLSASGLGKLGDPRSERALLEALQDADVSLLRAVVEALGKLGGPDSLQALAALSFPDAEVTRRAARARTLLLRRLSRGASSCILLDRKLGDPARLAVSCRAGLGALLLDEVARLKPRAVDATRVDIGHSGTLGELYDASRIALSFGLVVPVPRGPAPPATRISGALTRPATLGWLRAWTEGPLRFRLDFIGSGHQRELAWSIAETLSDSASPLQNDPRQADWTAHVLPNGDGDVILVPQVSEDPRFTYRKSDVRAASHPTLAAALARIASVRDDDVVWDPFVGSGLELVERARLGPYRRLVGSDLDAAALDAARQNLSAAAVERAELSQGDALELFPEGVTLILSNPPMGRRVARDGSIGTLLEHFTLHAARVLESGGRMVWLSPLPKLTARAAERAGLSLESGPELDLGGFLARVQVFRK